MYFLKCIAMIHSHLGMNVILIFTYKEYSWNIWNVWKWSNTGSWFMFFIFDVIFNLGWGASCAVWFTMVRMNRNEWLWRQKTFIFFESWMDWSFKFTVPLCAEHPVSSTPVCEEAWNQLAFKLELNFIFSLTSSGNHITSLKIMCHAGGWNTWISMTRCVSKMPGVEICYCRAYRGGISNIFWRGQFWPN